MSLTKSNTRMVDGASSISIESFGAVKNDSAVDNRSAIQAAIDFAAASSELKTVLIPEGTWYVDSLHPTLTNRCLVLDSRVTIQGAGQSNTFIQVGPTLEAGSPTSQEAVLGTDNTNTGSGLNVTIKDIKLSDFSVLARGAFNYAIKIGANKDDANEDDQNHYALRMSSNRIIGSTGVKAGVYIRGFLSNHSNVQGKWEYNDFTLTKSTWTNATTSTDWDDYPAGVHFDGSTTNIIEDCYGTYYVVGVKYSDIAYSTVSGAASDFCEIAHYATDCDNTNFHWGSEWSKVLGIVDGCDNCQVDVRGILTGFTDNVGEPRAAHYSDEIPDYAVIVSSSNIELTNMDIQLYGQDDTLATTYFAKNLVDASRGTAFVNYTGSTTIRNYSPYPL